MRTLIVYGSVYENTDKIAKVISNAITNQVKVVRVIKVNYSEFETFELLIISSPTQGSKPTEAIQDFLNKIHASAFRDAM